MSEKATASLTLALAGNPNCGKTALFNVLTGSCQREGNWPGVTVERKSGFFVQDKQRMEVVDLPGVYSLSVSSHQTSVDERIACEYLLSGQADVIVNVIDGANLERNLYLTLQLLEMQLPVVLAVNMMDVVERRGFALDLKKLSQLLQCEVVGLVARQGKGIDALKQAVVRAKNAARTQHFSLPMPDSIVTAIHTLTHTMHNELPAYSSMAKDWLAMRLLEGDALAESIASDELRIQAKTLRADIEQIIGEEADILIADARYGHLNQLTLKVTQLQRSKPQTFTQWLDKIVLNRFLGVPIFLLVMYLMFVFAINIAGAFQDFFDMSSNALFVDGSIKLFNSWHAPAWLTAIIANGVGKGINTTVTFIPVIGGMFLFLSFLEDSGYMARAAFVMDRCMRAIGLPGKSFVPMIVGFGCNVPAVMGARTLASKRDRVLTILMMPFMSCGARLAIFAVFGSAFFKSGGQDIIFLLYLTGIAVAVLTGFILQKTILPGEPSPLVMELPPYHLPRVGSLFRHAWYRLKRFLIRAGKYIVPICILIGTLNSISVQGKLVEQGSSNTVLANVGRVVTPVLAPMGIHQDNWPATVGLVTGILAKEVVVGSLNTLYSQVGHLNPATTAQLPVWTGLKQALTSIPQNLSGIAAAFKNPLLANEAPHEMSRTAYGVMHQRFQSKIAAFAYLLFVLLYFPCISTMAAIRREIGRGFAYFSMAWNTLLAYGLAVVTYQLFTLNHHPTDSLIWIFGMGIAMAMMMVFLKRYAMREPREVGVT